MNFPRFAFNNVSRNSRAYIAYFLSSAFMVMIFFTYAVYIYHPQIKDTPMGDMTVTGMGIATYIVYIFAIFFVLYSISVFLKSRNREFGILTILGARSGQINRLIFLENMIIGAASILTGILSGLLLTKLFLLISARVIDMEELPFYWPGEAILLTILSFTTLFVVVSAFTLLFINKTKVLELLKGTSKPKKEPKASFLLALFGTALLVTGYWSLHSGLLTPPKLLLAAVTGIAGTYFFYSQLSVWIIRFVQRRRNLTWGGVRLLWVSEMSYKLKDNARILFMVTVMIALASMSAGFVLALNETMKSTYLDNPADLTYYVSEEEYPEEEIAHIESVLEEEGLEYKRAWFETLYTEIGNNEHGYMRSISLTRYNELATTLEEPTISSLGAEEVVVVSTEKASRLSEELEGDTVDIIQEKDSYFLRYTERTSGLPALLDSTDGRLLVLHDDIYASLKKEWVEDGNLMNTMLVYWYPDKNGIPNPESPEVRAGVALWEWNLENLKSEEGGYYLSAKAQNYMEMKQTLGLFSFIGVFIALIFSMSSASFLYFKLHTELSTDAKSYQALSKIGLSVQEMGRSATIQIALLFFIPIIVATVQSLVVLEPVLSYSGIPTFRGPVMMTAGAFLTLQLVYFFIVRARYIRAVKQMMV